MIFFAHVHDREEIDEDLRDAAVVPGRCWVGELASGRTQNEPRLETPLETQDAKKSRRDQSN
jgi:hypothetical protein